MPSFQKRVTFDNVFVPISVAIATVGKKSCFTHEGVILDVDKVF